MRETSASRSCWRNPSTPLASMAANVTPSMPGAPLLAFAAAYAVRSVSSLPTWTDQSPEPPGRFGLRLGVDPPLQVLQPDRRPCHCVSASRVGGGTRTAGSLRSSGMSPPSALLRTRPPPSRRPPLSRGTPGYRAYPASAAFATGRGRLLQLLDMSWSPCCPYHPAEVSDGIGQRAASHAVFVPDKRSQPSDLIFLEATRGFTCVTAR